MDWFTFAWLHDLWVWWTERSAWARALIGLGVLAGFGIYWALNPEHVGAAAGVVLGGVLVLTALFD